MPHLKRTLRTTALACVMLLGFATAASAADLGIATVTAGGLRLRETASTEAKILTSAAEGDHVLVLSDAGEGWYKVNYDTVEGYMSGQYLDVAVKADVKLGYGKVQAEGSTLNIRSGPGTDYDRVGGLSDGAVVTIQGIDNGWFKIETASGTQGYVSSDYMTPCEKPAAQSGQSKGSSVQEESVSDEPVPASSVGQQVAQYAQNFLGCPYVWGGNGPNSFDCSGFTKYVYAQFGYTLNRTASAQLKNGVAVSRDQLQAGDLIFLNNGRVSTPVSHVGIYIGGGQFIHASSNSYSVEISSIYGHYESQLAYFRRIL